MRKTIFTIILISSFTTFSTAQKVDVGLNGGVMFHNIPRGDCLPLNDKSYYKPGYYVSLRGMTTRKNWQAGIGLDLYGTGIHYERSYILENEMNTIAPNLFVNRLVVRPKGHYYAGVTLGLAFTRFTANDLTPELMPFMYLAKDQLRGWQSGVQVGYTRKISKKFSANAEVAARYSHNEGKYMDYDQIIVPVSIGVRYRL